MQALAANFSSSGHFRRIEIGTIHSISTANGGRRGVAGLCCSRQSHCRTSLPGASECRSSPTLIKWCAWPRNQPRSKLGRCCFREMPHGSTACEMRSGIPPWRARRSGGFHIAGLEMDIASKDAILRRSGLDQALRVRRNRPCLLGFAAAGWFERGAPTAREGRACGAAATIRSAGRRGG
jgi:hypothetical protein